MGGWGERRWALAGGCARNLTFFIFSLLFSSLGGWGESTEAEKEENAKYVVSLARKLGAVIFLQPRDIVEVRRGGRGTVAYSDWPLALLLWTGCDNNDNSGWVCFDIGTSQNDDDAGCQSNAPPPVP